MQASHQRFGQKSMLHTEKVTDAEYHIRKFGYPFESHDVLTEDGYMLTLHRIPPRPTNDSARNNTFRSNKKARRSPVILHHGLLGASENWVFRGPNLDLCYILSDAGYDVWLSNARGNFYSRKHKSLNPDTDEKYWNFSFHEIGFYDLAASIEYILSLTQSPDLYFVGYSMGATVGYILCSTRPQYNSKIKLIVSLAPTAITAHKFSPYWKFLFNLVPTVGDSLVARNISELLPRRQLVSEVLTTICEDESPLQFICLTVMFLSVGIDHQQLNTSFVPSMFKYYPSGTSVKTVLHYYQLFTSGQFGPLLYGPEQNTTKLSKPLEYNLSKVTTPVSLHFGDGDALVTKQDNEALARRLSNVVGIFRVPFRHFNHLDFIWSSDSKRLLYDQVCMLMEKYR